MAHKYVYIYPVSFHIIILDSLQGLDTKKSPWCSDGSLLDLALKMTWSSYAGSTATSGLEIPGEPS